MYTPSWRATEVLDQKSTQAPICRRARSPLTAMPHHHWPPCSPDRHPRPTDCPFRGWPLRRSFTDHTSGPACSSRSYPPRLPLPWQPAPAAGRRATPLLIGSNSGILETESKKVPVFIFTRQENRLWANFILASTTEWCMAYLIPTRM
jgi:hypothetical protein